MDRKFLVDSVNRVYEYSSNSHNPNPGIIGIGVKNGDRFDHYTFLCHQSTEQAAYDWIRNRFIDDNRTVVKWNRKTEPVLVQFDIHGLPLPENAAVMPMNAEKVAGRFSID